MRLAREEDLTPAIQPKNGAGPPALQVDADDEAPLSLGQTLGCGTLL